MPPSHLPCPAKAMPDYYTTEQLRLSQAPGGPNWTDAGVGYTLKAHELHEDLSQWAGRWRLDRNDLGDVKVPLGGGSVPVLHPSDSLPASWPGPGVLDHPIPSVSAPSHGAGGLPQQELLPGVTTYVPTGQEASGMWQVNSSGRYSVTTAAGIFSDLTLPGAQRIAMEQGLPDPVGYGGPVTTSPAPQEGNNMDLGDIYDVVDASVGGWLPGGVPFGSVPVTGGYPAVQQQFTPPILPTVAQPQAQHQCGGASPVYKKVCGQYKWVQPKRRRRRRLLTQSDRADLAALKGILGQGKAMEMWIATHAK